MNVASHIKMYQRLPDMITRPSKASGQQQRGLAMGSVLTFSNPGRPGAESPSRDGVYRRSIKEGANRARQPWPRRPGPAGTGGSCLSVRRLVSRAAKNLRAPGRCAIDQQLAAATRADVANGDGF